MQKPHISINLIILFLWIVLPLRAQQVSEDEARLKAMTFLCKTDSPVNRNMKAPRKTPDLELVNSRDEFFIFNDEVNGGYVIVSGDVRMPEILGYSNEGHFAAKDLPDNIKAWLDGYAAQVDYLRSHPEAEVRSRRSVQGEGIAPMVECEWDQGSPFNMMCPNETPTGCVATAMAQVMYYHKWPERTRAVIPGYSYEGSEIYVPNYPKTTIHWEQMLPIYDAEGYTYEEWSSVARLMILCGASIWTNYNEGGSGATFEKVVESLPRYFGYDKSLSLVSYTDYNPDTWNQLMYDELASQRPVLYGGSNETINHAFVVDGYDGDDYFHMNWGWSGNMNGNYLLTALPDFQKDHCAVIGIQPSTIPLPETYGVLEDGTMTLYYDSEKDCRQGQVFSDLTINYPDYSSEIETLHCPQGPGMTSCVIDPSFADYELESLYGFFSGFDNLESIFGLSNLNTTYVIDMGQLFWGCSSLKDIDLSGLKTEQVIYMDGLFADCAALENLDLSNFNTENTVFMLYMFSGCSALKNLDLSGLNTNNVLDMYGTFEGCSSLTELNLNNFNTENVIDMAYTFRYCSSLKHLDLSHFDTRNVTQMVAMFEGCTSLESLDLSSFNTENVGYMYDMFMECKSLKSLDLSSFDTSNVIDMQRMFNGCESLESLDLSSFNTEKVTNMFYMFRYCTSLKNLNLSSFKTPNVTNMWGMFLGCESLESLDLSNFNPENVTDMREMFIYCSQLKNINLSGFNTSNVTNMHLMFLDCRSLETIYVSNEWNTSKVENGSNMFWCCVNLIGDQGTRWSEDHQGWEYAHIDGGPDNPGYLSNANSLRITNMSMNAGTQKSTQVKLRLYRKECSNIQFDLQLPVGLTITTKELVTEQTGDMVYSVTPQEDGTNTFIINSPSNSIVKPGDILSMTIKADKKLTAGNYELRLKNILISDTHGNTTELESSISTIKVVPPVTITAINHERYYGESNGELTYDISENYTTGTPTIFCEATSLSPAGEYEIIVGKGDILADSVTLVNGTLTIMRAPLTIGVCDETRYYGEDNPEFVLTYDGFISNEDYNALTSLPVVHTEADKYSDAGEYELTLSGGEAENYDISLTNGTLYILKVPQEIIWEQEFDEELKIGNTIALTAKSTCELPVSYALVDDDDAAFVSLYVEDDTWYIECQNEGTTEIRAMQWGDQNHLPAKDVVKTITIITDGIKTVTNDSQYADVYSIDGVKMRCGTGSLEGLAAGVYIVGKKKVVVK